MNTSCGPQPALHPVGLAQRLRRRVARASVAVAASLLGLTGCPNSSGGLLDDPGSAALPSLKVSLPAPPSFAEPSIPREYPDGSVSIYGLRKEFHRYSDAKNKYLGQRVKVKGFLQEIYVCEVCPKGQNCKQCTAPHMFIVDEVGAPKDKAMMVVEQRGFKGKEPKITVGKQYVFEGNFQQTSKLGFSASDGLVVFFKMMDDTNKEFIGPAAIEEAEALKLEAAMKAKMGQAGAAPTPPAAGK